MAKMISQALALVALVVANDELSAKIMDELTACQNEGKGSMTISRKGTKAKATILAYKIPLTDEKRIRQWLQTVDNKLQISRSNDLALREEQYGFTHNVSELRKQTAKADKPKASETTPTDSTTPTVDANGQIA